MQATPSSPTLLPHDCPGAVQASAQYIWLHGLPAMQRVADSLGVQQTANVLGCLQLT